MTTKEVLFNRIMARAQELIAESGQANNGELARIAEESFLRSLEDKQDSANTLLSVLPQAIPTEQVACGSSENSKGTHLWGDFGALFILLNRLYPALSVYLALYEHQLDYQQSGRRIHKRGSLFEASHCYELLNMPVHAKRYLMLTLIEDAITHQGNPDLNTTGSYFKLVWHYGFTHNQVMEYAQQSWGLCQAHPDESRFPERVLYEMDKGWATELPEPNEMSSYIVNKQYCQYLLSRMGGNGKGLEHLTHYLVSCIPGCRAYHRKLRLCLAKVMDA